MSDETKEYALFINDVSVRDGDSDGAGIVEGYAAVFNSPTQIGFGDWAFLETIKPGAFRKTIKESDQLVLWNHNSDGLPLGRRSTGDVILKEDKRGLHCEVSLPNTSLGRDVYELVKRGIVTGMSFAFNAIRESWTNPKTKEDGPPTRELKEVVLHEVSPVNWPAYKDTSIFARDAQSIIQRAEQRGLLTTEPDIAIQESNQDQDTTSESDQRHLDESAPDEQDVIHSEESTPETVCSKEAGPQRLRIFKQIQRQKEAELGIAASGGTNDTGRNSSIDETKD